MYQLFHHFTTEIARISQYTSTLTTIQRSSGVYTNVINECPQHSGHLTIENKHKCSFLHGTHTYI